MTGAKWEWTFRYPRYGITRRSGTVGRQPLVVPDRRGGPVQPHARRRDPRVLDARGSLQARSDPGRDPERDVDVSERGRVPGTVRRVLRAAPRRHGVHGPRGRAGRVRGWARSGGRAPVVMSAAAPAALPAPRLTGWLGALTSTDHKRIGLNLGHLLAGVLPARRRVRAADARPARPAQRALRLGQHLQPAVHDARLDDDLPVRHADGDRAGDVPGAAADRRRSAVAAPRLALDRVLDLAVAAA